MSTLYGNPLALKKAIGLNKDVSGWRSIYPCYLETTA